MSDDCIFYIDNGMKDMVLFFKRKKKTKKKNKTNGIVVRTPKLRFNRMVRLMEFSFYVRTRK